MPLSSNKWVFFKILGGEEVYVTSLEMVPGSGRMALADQNVREALGFGTAREAYDYGARLAPTLDDWRVGLRSG
jgi:hypothetical protein